MTMKNLLSVAIIAFVSLPLTVNGQTLRVFDANGKKVGEVIAVPSPGGPVVTALKVGARRFPLWVYQAGFAGDDGTTGFGAAGTRVYFETSDCSGTAFAVPGSILPHIVVARPGRTVYFADSAEAPQPIIWLSFLPETSQGQDPGACSSEGGPQMINAVPAIPLIDLDTQFTPPLSVR